MLRTNNTRAGCAKLNTSLGDVTKRSIYKAFNVEIYVSAESWPKETTLASLRRLNNERSQPCPTNNLHRLAEIAATKCHRKKYPECVQSVKGCVATEGTEEGIRAENLGL